eukprot:CAMPEP_0197180894 /NCGR_PEP_ID=MMETSP1423-20130617/5334_1 /TAXON_ID=476441 /ORGANISM="Pseudo-nitzschia heimii, Strain UNC1101" /LENGTH=895 /DNA_ID=CAMNT_0042631035 /DNA_START=189 /DNA_END=2873 /DNA_ORIENTATION=-
MMRKRVQVLPISSDDHSARSGDASTRSTRSRIRLRNSSSKYYKQHQKLGLFGKRPYLYKASDQSISTSRFNILYPGVKQNSDKNSEYQCTSNNTEHWIEWLDSGIEFFGCGITTSANVVASEDENHQSFSPHRQGRVNAQSCLNLQKEQDSLARKKRHIELLERDYVQLHEDFFDCLLKEEGEKMVASIATTIASQKKNEYKGSEINSTNSSSFSIGSTSTSGNTTETNRTVEAQNSSDSISNVTRTSTKSGPSVSSSRTVRLNRRASFGKNVRKVTKGTNFKVYEQQFNPVTSANTKSIPALHLSTENAKGTKSASSVLSIQEIMAKSYLESPSQYLHLKCKLQKDKGKGDRLGSAISARGREPTIAKLREKMKLIVEVSGELQSSYLTNNSGSTKMPSSASESNPSGSAGVFKAMSAGMKRRKAKIAAIEHSESCMNGAEVGSYIIETRSMIELQLGFLSMQYGLLLRWDAYQSGQIVFVCLRKMCHDSFYTKIRSPPIISTTVSVTSKSSSGDSSSLHPKPFLKHKPQQSPKNETNLGHPPRVIAATKKRVATPPLVVRVPKGGNHAIYQRASGATEVVLVDAPYRVPHPDIFAPSILSLDVHRLTGLDPKSRWTLVMTFDGDTEIAHLKYNHREGVFETTRTAPCKWEISMMPQRQAITSFDVATGLEIRLFEQRPKYSLRGVASGVAGMVGGRSSSNYHVPPGSDPFSLTSPSNSYMIRNQRLIYYHGNFSNQGGIRRISRTYSENSIGSSNSGASGSTGGSSSLRHSAKKSTSRLASTMTVPLGGLICQPSTCQTTLWKLTIPFTHDEDAEVTLTLMHQSDYAFWLYQELRARRKEEIASSSTTPSSDLWRLLVSTKNPRAINYDEKENYDDNTQTNDSDDSEVYFTEW